MKRSIDPFVVVSLAVAVASPVLFTIGLGSKAVRDASLAFVAVSGASAIVALVRAVRRGGAVAWTLAGASAAIASLFAVGATTLVRVPDTGRVPRAGDAAPAFSLPAAGGGTVSLGSLLEEGPVLLVFLRGVW